MSKNFKFGSVADLFATIGLDMSALDAGLADSKIKLEGMKGPITDLASQLEALGRTVGPVAVNEAMSQLERQSYTTAESIQLISLGLDELNAKRQAEALMAERSAIMRAEAERADEFATAEDIEMERAKQLEYKRTFEIYMESLNHRRIVHRAELADEREAERIVFEQRRREYLSALPGGGPAGIGFRGTAVELQAIDQLLGIHIPRGLTSVLARVGQVQAAMASAFGVFAIIGFIEILIQLANKVHEVSDEIRGLDAESRKTWENASKGVEQSVLKTVEFRNAIREVREAGLKGRELHEEQGKNAKLEIQDILEQIKVHSALRAALAQTHEALKSYPAVRTDIPYEEFLKADKAASEAIRHYGDQKKALESVNTEHETESKLLDELNLKLGQARREEEKRQRQADSSRETQKKLRDPIHELPYRLPWFMGESPADSFLRNLHGGPQRSAQAVTAPVLQYRNPVMPRTAGLLAPTHGSEPSSPSTAQTGGGRGVSVTVQNTYAPSFKFDGVPADIQKFMRDQAEPMLAADLEKNARGLTDRVVKALRDAGVGA